MLFIVDIDFTIADGTERMQKAGMEPGRHDQAAYDSWLGKLQTHETMMSDRPYTQMRDLLATLASSGHHIVYLTGRSEQWRNTTVQWLLRFEFPLGDELVMRSPDDYRSAGDYKEEEIRKINSRYRLPAIALDDDSASDTSERYRKLGIYHLKALGDRV